MFSREILDLRPQKEEVSLKYFVRSGPGPGDTFILILPLPDELNVLCRPQVGPVQVTNVSNRLVSPSSGAPGELLTRPETCDKWRLGERRGEYYSGAIKLGQ